MFCIAVPASESNVRSNSEPMDCEITWHRPGVEEAELHSFPNILPLSNFCNGAVLALNFDEMSDLQDNYVIEVARRNRAKAAAAQEAQAAKSTANPGPQQQKSSEKALMSPPVSINTPRAPFLPTQPMMSLPLPRATNSPNAAAARYPGDGIRPLGRLPTTTASGSCNWSFVNVNRHSVPR